MTSGRDHYEILGVAHSASDAEIQRAYRRLARRYHPDINPSDDARMRFEELTCAYEVLHDPQRRNRYDRATAGPRSAAPPAPVFAQRHPRRDVPRFLDDTPRGSVQGEPRAVVTMWVRRRLW